MRRNTNGACRRIAAVATVAAFALGIGACRWSGFNDAPAKATAAEAVDWLLTQQQADGGFEVAAFAGFETPDAIIAIAEDAQQQFAWNPTQARNAVLAATENGNTPLSYMDDFLAGSINAGDAAKAIVLVTQPLGLSATAFDPDGDGARNLVTVVNNGQLPNGSYGTFNATLYAALARKLTTGGVPATTVAFIRAAQEPFGGWDFQGEPSGNDADVDSTALAIQALAAAGVAPNDTDLRQGLAFLANSLRPNGAFQSFGNNDPNSTSTAVLAIAAAGFDPTVRCWRNTVAPSLAGQTYVSPTAWLQTQQNPNGRITSPNDPFGINTFATSQTVQALRRGWVPVSPLLPQSCS